VPDVKKVGIWIDRRRAVVVVIEDGEESQRVIDADVERHAKPSGGWRTSTPWGPQAPVSEHGREEHYRHQVARFYKEVIKAVGKPDQLLVMGPAQAKREFADMVEKAPELRGVALKVENADRMTDPQVAARVRDTVF
jgi:stalled ribosome rescue protein Dom34